MGGLTLIEKKRKIWGEEHYSGVVINFMNKGEGRMV